MTGIHNFRQKWYRYSVMPSIFLSAGFNARPRDEEYDSIALQQAVINLNTAFDNFFNPKLRAKCPTLLPHRGQRKTYHARATAFEVGSLSR